MSSIDLSNLSALHSDLHAQLAHLRENDPVAYLPELGAYYVSRHEDVKGILNAPDKFSNTAVRKITYSGFYTGGVPPYPEGRARALMNVDQIIGADEPDHRRVRAHFARPFLPGSVRVYQDRIREICRTHLDECLASEGDNLNIVEFAVPTTLDVLALFVGIEPERYLDFRRWTVDFIQGISGSEVPESFTQSVAQMSDYLWQLVEDRRANPRADIVTAMTEAQYIDPQFSDDELFVNLVLLLQAGHETTSNTVANAVHLFSRFPEQYQLLREQPDLLQTAIAEVLRYESPVTVLTRLTLEDVEIGGVVIPKDKVVMISIGSANLDGAVFPEPERFDIERDHKESVAFGHGIHFCAGSALAKLETRIILSEIMERFTTIEDAGLPWQWHDSLIFRGPQSFCIKKPVPQ